MPEPIGLRSGGTTLNVLAELAARGATPEYIRIVTVVVAPPALENISKQFPGKSYFRACKRRPPSAL